MLRLWKQQKLYLVSSSDDLGRLRLHLFQCLKCCLSIGFLPHTHNCIQHEDEENYCWFNVSPNALLGIRVLEVGKSEGDDCCQ